MALVDHNYMVQALAANRADDSLDVCILPGRSWRRNDLRDPHSPSPLLKAFPVRRVAVSQEVAWRGIPRKCLGDLAGEPTCGRMLGDIQMQNLPSRVAEDNAHVQQAKRGGDDHKHIDGGDAVHLIAQEGPPGCVSEGLSHQELWSVCQIAQHDFIRSRLNRVNTAIWVIGRGNEEHQQGDHRCEQHGQ
jgi:hypothetical protein